MIKHRLLHLFAAIVLVALPALPSAAFAQQTPYGYGHWNNNANGNYDDRGRYNRDRRTSITATVSHFEPFNLWIDGNTHVYLHQGTIINPTGITLHRGMRVTIWGYQNRDGSFNADQIDVDRRGRGYGDRDDRNGNNR